MSELLNTYCCSGEEFVGEKDEWSVDVLMHMFTLLSDSDKKLLQYSFSGKPKEALVISNTINDMYYLFAILYMRRYYGDENLFSDIDDLLNCAYEYFRCKNINIKTLLSK